MLSSLPDLVVTDAYIPTLDSTNLFRSGDSSQQSNDSEIVQLDNEDFLVSEFGIEEFGWRLLLLAPLEARQAQMTKYLPHECAGCRMLSSSHCSLASTLLIR